MHSASTLLFTQYTCTHLALILKKMFGFWVEAQSSDLIKNFFKLCLLSFQLNMPPIIFEKSKRGLDIQDPMRSRLAIDK